MIINIREEVFFLPNIGDNARLAVRDNPTRNTAFHWYDEVIHIVRLGIGDEFEAQFARGGVEQQNRCTLSVCQFHRRRHDLPQQRVMIER
ncbi:MAG: hypothetical protein HC828_14250 [Blastochloris sp.]|nr:hypothetical protein [Blastochloris sp.]